ncbi:MAG: hypothetical protein HBSAPP03_09280 [Phycisphaerae bacterium]|nr:MAG: hypothetical protein HBSAPP03_09280 [Phycisphaerae bacterium]
MGTLRAIFAAASSMAAQASSAQPVFRPPAVPLVAHNPYFSAWCMGDQLAADWPRHWSGAVLGMAGMVRIDGVAYRWCGAFPQHVPAMKQAAVAVTATRTVFSFEQAGVGLTVAFCSPVIADDPDLASRTVTYLTVQAASRDGREHEVEVYVDCSGEWATHTPDQEVRWSRVRTGGIEWLSFASTDQPVLKRVGDQTRMDWGTFYLGAATGPNTLGVMTGHTIAREGFAANGVTPTDDDLRQPRAARDDWPVLAFMTRLGRVVAEPKHETFYLAYDDQFCVEYFGRKLRPYWARAGKPFAEMLAEQVAGRDTIEKRCDEADRSVRARLERSGGAAYATIGELAYRQTMAAHVIAADIDGAMLMFPKENSSNGCIGTVDVFFPSAPFFLVENPELLRAQLRPVLEYAAGPRWKFPFAPHDLGTYPKANGQVYGGGETSDENQMPVEESANMLILVHALAKHDGHAAFTDRSWPTLTAWAEYLKAHGLDPENQLCTDDFTGHLARNANLAAKAIVALGAYAALCDLRGDKDAARTWRDLAERYAREWAALAGAGGPGPSVLAYGQPGTWSLKYNLYWDIALGLDLFPRELIARELAHYRAKANRYGIPLDSRADFTKLDFLAWVAAMGGREDFEALFAPIHAFANDTPQHVPLSDWYDTKTSRQTGFQARSVVGGVWAKLYRDSAR